MKRWDIFCRVIDNFGDIGVCWRLAKQLSVEHNLHVRLWVDDLSAFAKLLSLKEVESDSLIQGIRIVKWAETCPQTIDTADVVIEAFACDIPSSYLAAMKVLRDEGHPPVWINLEYLSAEPWVEDCHLMTSTHPSTGLKKHFFFPGFSAKTGGLLRETDLTNHGDTKKNHPQAPLRISLFTYENTAVTSLINCLTSRTEQFCLLIPEGRALSSVAAAIGQPLQANSRYTMKNLEIHVLPFSTQEQYDQLLASCDINFVRGEDSFVRAQWAGKPFIWHIYQQEEDAHFIKLNAFLERFLPNIPSNFRSSLHSLWGDWNREAAIEQSLHDCLDNLSEWHAATMSWREHLCLQPDLATQLVTHVIESQ